MFNGNMLIKDNFILLKSQLALIIRDKEDITKQGNAAGD
jgi:hypothetical protein